MNIISDILARCITAEQAKELYLSKNTRSFNKKDEKLVKKAKKLFKAIYEENRYHAVCIAIGRSGEIYTGVGIIAKRGYEFSFYPETRPILNSNWKNDPLVTMVTVGFRPNESRNPNDNDYELDIISPNGASREHLIRWAKECLAILKEDDRLFKKPVVKLLPNTLLSEPGDLRYKNIIHPAEELTKIISPESFNLTSLSTTEVERLINEVNKLAYDRCLAGFHHTACIAVGKSGKIYPGIHLNAPGNRAFSLCAETRPILNSDFANDPIVIIVTAKFKPNDKGIPYTPPSIVPPCGICRERLKRFASPEGKVILCDKEGIIYQKGTIFEFPISKLLPWNYLESN